MMTSLFEYNWLVREEWFDALEELTLEELNRSRTGGVGTIRKTFFHIMDVEYSWIRACMGLHDDVLTIDDYPDLASLRELSLKLRQEITEYLDKLEKKSKDTIILPSWLAGESYTLDEVIPHILVHEIHHIGQLSVWAKDIPVKVVSANFIGRGLGSASDNSNHMPI